MNCSSDITECIRKWRGIFYRIIPSSALSRESLKERLVESTSEYAATLIIEVFFFSLRIMIKQFPAREGSYPYTVYGEFFYLVCSEEFVWIEPNVGSPVCYQYDCIISCRSWEGICSQEDCITYSSARKSWTTLEYTLWTDSSYDGRDSFPIFGKWNHQKRLPSKYYKPDGGCCVFSYKFEESLSCLDDAGWWDIFSKHGSGYIENDEYLAFLLYR